MASVDFEMGEVRAFAADVSRASVEVVAGVRPVVKKAGVQIKKQLRAEMGESSNRGIRTTAQSINFDVIEGGFGVEVGPDKPRGSLANIAYFGTSRGGGHTRDPRETLEAEASVFLDEIGKLGEESLSG